LQHILRICKEEPKESTVMRVPKKLWDKMETVVSRAVGAANFENGISGAVINCARRSGTGDEDIVVVAAVSAHAPPPGSYRAARAHGDAVVVAGGEASRTVSE
jgi:hypothetical protein